MPSLPPMMRCLLAFSTAILPVPLFCALTFVCADLLGSAGCLAPGPDWTRFAVICALSSSLPSALYAFSDRTRTDAELIREHSRAVLITFGFFAAALLSLAGPFMRWIGAPILFLPAVLSRFAFGAACPLVLLSSYLAEKLLPTEDGAASPASPRLRRFGISVLVLSLIPFAAPLLTEGAVHILPAPFSAVLFLCVCLTARRQILQGRMLPALLWPAVCYAAIDGAAAVLRAPAGPEALTAAACALSAAAASLVLLIHAAAEGGLRR
ncbi:MAG: hypothetical protein MJ061_02475 [Mailhella sp.]|nr:hypothetical protein [Mailhella sp.]